MGKYEDVLDRIKLFNKEYNSIIEEVKNKYPILKRESPIILGLDDNLGRDSTMITKIVKSDRYYYKIEGLNYFQQTIITTNPINGMDEGWESINDPHYEPTTYKALKSIFEEGADLNKIAKEEIYNKIRKHINSNIEYEKNKISESMNKIDEFNSIINNLE